MIKAIIITLCMISSVLLSNEQSTHKHLPYEVTLSLLQNIDSDALVLGKGEKILYVFLDPLCPHSRKFITMVSKNSKMLSKYQYHLFLYSIPRMKSKDVVSAIYMSQHSIKTLLEIMLKEKVRYDTGSESTKARVARIAKVAEEIDVYKRPYIFIVK